MEPWNTLGAIDELNKANGAAPRIYAGQWHNPDPTVLRQDGSYPGSGGARPGYTYPNGVETPIDNPDSAALRTATDQQMTQQYGSATLPAGKKAPVAAAHPTSPSRASLVAAPVDPNRLAMQAQIDQIPAVPRVSVYRGGDGGAGEQDKLSGRRNALLDALSTYDNRNSNTSLASAQAKAEPARAAAAGVQAGATKTSADADAVRAGAEAQHIQNETDFIGNKSNPLGAVVKGLTPGAPVNPADAQIALSDPRYAWAMKKVLGQTGPDGKPTGLVGDRLAELHASGLLDHPVLGPLVKSAFSQHWAPQAQDFYRKGYENWGQAAGFGSGEVQSNRALLKKHFAQMVQGLDSPAPANANVQDAKYAGF